MKTSGVRRLIRVHKEGESFISTNIDRDVSGNCCRLNVKAKTQRAILVFPQEDGEELAIRVTVATILDKKHIKERKKRSPNRQILPT